LQLGIKEVISGHVYWFYG